MYCVHQKISQNKIKFYQILAAFGNWGRWQTLCFAIMGLPVIVTSYPILIMTFMNAKVDFWCRRPRHFPGLPERLSSMAKFNTG